MSCFTRILHLFRCLFKQQLHNVSCMCALLLFPIILFLFQAASVRTDSDRITVLLFASQPDATVSELFETLTEWEQTVSGGAAMSEEELAAVGGNDSMNHVDFMVGTDDLKIVGIQEDGTEVVVFENGVFAQ